MQELRAENAQLRKELDIVKTAGASGSAAVLGLGHTNAVALQETLQVQP
jgi:hypothetical protein